MTTNRLTFWRSLLLGALLLLALAKPAGAAVPISHSAPSLIQAPVAYRPCAFPAVILAGSNWVSDLFTKFEGWLNNRTHMIQFCAIGMVLGLIIIWWRKT
jgi:hypothetical protein